MIKIVIIRSLISHLIIDVLKILKTVILIEESIIVDENWWSHKKFRSIVYIYIYVRKGKKSACPHSMCAQYICPLIRNLI